jgi:hypothetical protein
MDDDVGVDNIVIRAFDGESTVDIKADNEAVARFYQDHSQFIQLTGLDPHQGM